MSIKFDTFNIDDNLIYTVMKKLTQTQKTISKNS